MKREDAEEFTQSLGQIVGGSYRQVALAERLGVPQALGLTTVDWVNQRLGGYVKMAAKPFRNAVADLKAEGRSNRNIAGVLGVSDETVNRVVRATNVALEPDGDAESATNVAPIEPVIAVGEREILAEAKRIREERVDNDRAARSLAKAAALELNIPEGCYRAIVTDPPYQEDYLPLYEKLSAFASTALRHGDPSGAPLQGQAVLYIGSRPHEFSAAFGRLGQVLLKAAP